jgi:hypothetical protein
MTLEISVKKIVNLEKQKGCKDKLVLDSANPYIPACVIQAVGLSGALMKRS